MRYIFFILIISVMFSCSNKNEEMLNERTVLINGTMDQNILIASKENEALFNKLNNDNKTKLDTIQKLSKEIKKYVNNLKSDMIEYSGGYTEYGELVNTNDYLISFQFIKNSKSGERFKETLDAFPTLITELEIFDAQKIIIDGRDDPYWSKLPNQYAKSALELLFKNSNLSSSLATVNILQNKLLEYERRVYQQFLLDELDSLRAR